jgi:hypothetical protein
MVGQLDFDKSKSCSRRADGNDGHSARRVSPARTDADLAAERARWTRSCSPGGEHTRLPVTEERHWIYAICKVIVIISIVQFVAEMVCRRRRKRCLRVREVRNLRMSVNKRFPESVTFWRLEKRGEFESGEQVDSVRPHLLIRLSTLRPSLLLMSPHQKRVKYSNLQFDISRKSFEHFVFRVHCLLSSHFSSTTVACLPSSLLKAYARAASPLLISCGRAHLERAHLPRAL